MKSRHSRESISSIIRSAFPPNACFVEWRDHFDKVSVRLYDVEGDALFTTEDMPVAQLRLESTLSSRIRHWQALRNAHLQHDFAKQSPGKASHAV